jgi:aspartyl-tRNA(Asn)/glutamyl-tRNA(Gln) amidotransferase subunit A
LPAGLVVDKAVADGWEGALSAIERAGATRVAITLPNQAQLFRLCEIIVKSEAAAMHGEWFRHRPEDYSAYMRSRIEGGFFIPATFYIEALSRRGKSLEDFVSSVFTACDVIVMPTTTRTAPLHQADGSGNASNLGGMASFTRPFNYLGLPSISIPSGFDDDGLPTAIQLIGRPMADHVVLDVATGYQSITGWHHSSPS